MRAKGPAFAGRPRGPRGCLAVGSNSRWAPRGLPVAFGAAPYPRSAALPWRYGPSAEVSRNAALEPAVGGRADTTGARIWTEGDMRRIVSDPKVLGGKPVVEGTRMSVEQLLGLLAKGA